MAGEYTPDKDAYKLLAREVSDDHQYFGSLLATDWTRQRLDDGVSVPVYLDNLDDEVNLIMHSDMLTLAHGVFRHFSPKIEREALNNPDSLLRRIWDASGTHFSYVQRFYGQGRFPTHHQEYADILYSNQLIRRVTELGRNDPERAIETLIENEPDEVMRQVGCSAMDWAIYAAARNNKDLERAHGRIRFASSPTIRAAMDAGLDRKVLKYAIRDQKQDLGLAREYVMEYASSANARETMLGYLAMRGRGGPRWTGWYRPHVTDEIRRDRQRGHDRARREEAYRLYQEAHKAYEEASEQARQAAEEARRMHMETDALIDELLAKLGISREEAQRRANQPDRYMAVLRTLPWEFRTQLEKFGRDRVQRVIGAIDTLRAQDPEVATTGVIKHFHAKVNVVSGQATDEEAKEDWMILHALLQDNVGRKAALTF